MKIDQANPKSKVKFLPRPQAHKLKIGGQKENEIFMNIQEMLSKMDSKMLMQGLKQLSEGLSPEQLKEAENAIKGTAAAKELGGTDINALKSQLQQNPELLKSLAQNRDLVAKLEKILKK